MPCRADGLFERIATFEALCAAARRAVAGKRRKPVPAAFHANLEAEVLRLERQLRDGTWRPGRYLEIEVTDPKRRLVSAAPFRDRVVHHAVHAVVAPLFERSFIHHSYANRVGKGTHRAVARYERLRDRYRYVLRGDICRGSHRATATPGGLAGPLSPRVARRRLEQQSEEPPLGQPQQERCRQPEQQRRVPCREHAPKPEPVRQPPRRARPGASRTRS